MNARFVRTVLSLAIAVAAVGCGSDSTAPGPGSTSSTISISDNSFTPSSTTVAVGTTVTWNWNGSNSHSVTWVSGSPSGAGPKSSGTYQRTFDAAGTYQYYCQIHGSPTSGMRGTVIVQ
jgi:plastocyanin